MGGTRMRRSGFTLAEVLVTVAIVSILAAVVIPAVASQLNKGDVGRASNDFVNIRTGIEQYLADVRRYPATVGQLTKKPVAGTDTGLVGGTISTLQANRWRGPYISKDSANALNTGFGAAGLNQFVSFTVNGQPYITYVVPGMDTLSAVALDQQMDDGNTGTGSIRWIKKGATGTDTLKYVILPIQ